MISTPSHLVIQETKHLSFEVWNFEIHEFAKLPKILKWPRPKHSNWKFQTFITYCSRTIGACILYKSNKHCSVTFQLLWAMSYLPDQSRHLQPDLSNWSNEEMESCVWIAPSWINVTLFNPTKLEGQDTDRKEAKKLSRDLDHTLIVVLALLWY